MKMSFSTINIERKNYHQKYKDYLPNLAGRSGEGGYKYHGGENKKSIGGKLVPKLPDYMTEIVGS